MNEHESRVSGTECLQKHFFSVYLGYFQLEWGTAMNQLNRPLSWWEFYSIKSSQQRCLRIILRLLNRASTIRIHQHSYQLSNRLLHVLDQNNLVQHTGCQVLYMNMYWPGSFTTQHWIEDSCPGSPVCCLISQNNVTHQNLLFYTCY